MIAKRFAAPLYKQLRLLLGHCLTVNQWEGNMWKLYLETGIIKSGRGIFTANSLVIFIAETHKELNF